MHLTEWNDSLVLGVDRIDDDHEKLVGMLNDCYCAFMLNNHDRELAAIIKELRGYTHYHFEHERKLMIDRGYPESASHFEAHEQFTCTIQEFADRFHAGESFIAHDVLTFLSGWLVAHIQKSDREFVAFLKAKD